MRHWLAVLAFVLGAASPAHAQSPSPHAIDIPKWFTESFLDFREDIVDAKRANRRLMVYFGQDGCPYCKALMKGNFGDPSIAAYTQKHFVALALNLWGDREVTWLDGAKMSEKELARKLEVQFTPTLLFFDEEGRVALRLNGYMPPDKFRIALEYAGERLEKREPYTDYMARRAGDKPGGALASQPFFEKGVPELPRILASARKPVIVLFERKGCAECAELHREGFTRPEVKALVARFAVVQLDLGGSRKVVTPAGEASSERDWARAMRVTYTPSLVFLDAAGKEVFRAEGYLKPFHLASALDYVASGAYRGEPSFQRFIQQRADKLRAAGQNVDVWQ